MEVLGIDTYLRVIHDAHVLNNSDLLNAKVKATQETKQREMKIYNKNKTILEHQELNRLKHNSNYSKIVDFDCGPCSKCKINRDRCNDGRNCIKIKKDGNVWSRS